MIAKKSAYISEANLVNILSPTKSYNDQSLFPVAFPPEDISVRVYRDAKEALDTYKTFDFDYINVENPLLEKELFGLLEKVLQSNGMTRNKENPQAIISMNFYIGKKEQYTPPTTVISTKLMPGLDIGMIGGTMGWLSSTVPITSSRTTPGYTTITYYSNIHLNFLNHSKLISDVKPKVPPIIWIGEAESDGFNSDIRGIAPTMFDKLLSEFLGQSKKTPIKNSIQHFRYGGLGLGFNQKDWREINYVEPSSVAEEHGIKPGDRLITIAGRSANKVSSSENEPYFQNILSNHGDKEVDLIIASPGKLSPIKIKITPKYEDRYINIDAGLDSKKNQSEENPLPFLVFFFSLVALVVYLLSL